ncbi:mazG nucleotide pyrophosphohydrolase [Cronobacter phage CR5]|uniref:mazG nucleotide pyrophosphohydrolase n=1 Tax=Cronobacter phage CR5 TaxID=1195085 RepID=UPI00034250F4|nr:mazG nucleotide pyrophosphohydrolase [Cronobacter phage CR5]AFO71336.1 hypothetical protein CR5_116 [Cronobacter phage CR5]
MTRQTFQVPVAYTIIKPTDGVLGDLIPSINKWSAQQAAHLSGPGVKLEALKEIAINNETKQWRISGREAINGDVWFWMTPTALVFEHEVVGKTTYPRDVPLFSVAECVENVVGWSTARGILENGRWATQVTKFYEEDGEAATGISKTQRQAIMDGLGDALVVLVNITALIDWTPKVIAVMLDRARDRIENNVPFGDSHRLFHKMRLNFTLMNDVIYNACDMYPLKDNGRPLLGNDEGIEFEELMLKSLWYMEALARAYEVTLEQCFSLAWDEIKDRKGYLNADGIFIKEADAK